MRHTLFAGVAVAALIVPVAASAQETTSIIRGRVTQDGAPVANASVAATEVNSGTRAEVKTDVEGNFTFPGLRPGGPYKVEVSSAQGNAEITDIFTVVQQTYELPIELAPARAFPARVTHSLSF